MNVILFLAADYAKKDASGKLDVIGIFNQINPLQFPYRHRTLYLVMKVHASLGEYTDHDIKILFVDEDGNELGSIDGQLHVERPPTGSYVEADLIIEVGDLLLSKPGRYEFRLIINKDFKIDLPLEVRQRQSQGQ